LKCCWRLENNFSQGSAVIEAAAANETDRFWNFDETKSSALIETLVQQMRYARWMFETESSEGTVITETPCSENSDIPINTKSLGKAQISKHFAAVRPHQAIISNQKVVTV
jgi:hypothetical protein